LGVEIAGMDNDIEDTEQSMEEDKKFVQELAVNCEKKKKRVGRNLHGASTRAFGFGRHHQDLE